MFTTPLIVKRLPEDKWRLMTCLVYEGTETVFIPTGFITDFASIPRIAWFYCTPATGRYVEPSVLHDYLCEHGKSLGINQRKADLLFLEAMKNKQVSWIKRNIMYWNVRLYQTLKGRY